MKAIKAMRGTRDIKGIESEKFNFVENTAKKLLENYGYGRIITPTFESTDLFQRGIGEGTDIVDKEMYTFSDKKDRSITLRPEGTASVVRSYIENKTYGKEELTKYYYVGQMFRYERPQAGRFREFYQIGVEVLGSNSPMIDAEVITMGYNLIKKLGIEDIKVNINSVGGSETRKAYTDILVDYLEEKRFELCDDCKVRYEKNPLRVLDCKEEKCQLATSDAPLILDSLNEDEKNQYNEIKEYLDMFEVEYTENPRLVRGLDYYSSTVFEITTEKLGAQGTVLGGGRYDNLVNELGNKDVPAVGFALGIDRIMMLLDDKEVASNPDVYIGWSSEDVKSYAFSVAMKLRNSGLNVAIEYSPRSANANRKRAFKIGAKNEIIIDIETKDTNTIKIKKLKCKEIEVTTIENIIKGEMV